MDIHKLLDKAFSLMYRWVSFLPMFKSLKFHDWVFSWDAILTFIEARWVVFLVLLLSWNKILDFMDPKKKKLLLVPSLQKKFEAWEVVEVSNLLL